MLYILYIGSAQKFSLGFGGCGEGRYQSFVPGGRTSFINQFELNK